MNSPSRLPPCPDDTSGVALVTGASRGIGRATAIALAESGHDIVGFHRSNDDAAAQTAESVERLHQHYYSYKVDVADESEVRAAFRAFLRQTGGVLDVAVLSAGVTADGLAATMSSQRFDEVIAVNLRGSFLVCRDAIKAMRRRGGAIVIVSSTSGVSGQAGQANYSASKGGVNAMTQALAKEVARMGIRVNAVAPGLTDTDMLARMDSRARREVLQLIPLGRAADPAEVARVIRFLASADASYITGQIVRVDGGLTA